MSANKSSRRISVAQLILIPAAISLLITFIRLVGELQHWSPAWFSPETGGVIPSGWSWVIGITWLPVPFGVYFALKLSRAGEGPSHAGKAVGFAFLGIAIFVGFYRLVLPALSIDFPQILIPIWLSMMIPAAIQYLAWPAMFRTLLAYGLAARIPVVAVMLLAMMGDWGTHYGYEGVDAALQMPLWPRFFWLAFFPQLLFWVAYTVLVGSLAGSLTAAIAHRSRSTEEANPQAA